MKKLITIALILAMLLPAAALAESYEPLLGMTMDEFILKYNAVSAPLESPYVSLNKPFSWTKWEGFNVAWFYADKTKTVTILLLSKDPTNSVTTSGLDEIQIFAKSDSAWVPLIGVTNRCASLFSAQLFGTSMSPMYIGDTIAYYYENNCEEKGLTAMHSLDEDNSISIIFFHQDTYYFKISASEAFQ